MENINYVNYKGYRGTKLLKKAGVQLEWTKDMVEEYQKCSKDPIYFIEKYIKIVHVDRGLIPMELYPYQRDIIHSLYNNRYTIVCTSRQAGKTTSLVAYFIWYILFNPYKTGAILANRRETAIEILSRIKLAYQFIPKWLQQGIVDGGWNATSIELENGSRLLADATGSDSIRGYSISFLAIDEAAHIEGWDDFSKSVIPTITAGKTSQIVLISTPNGLNHFHKTWELAERKENDYNPIMVPWQAIPGRDETWRKQALADLNFDMDKFAQEYENQFLGSSGTLIAGWKLKELIDKMPISSSEGIKKYQNSEKGRVYVMTVDCSEGKGMDYNTFSIIDVTQMPYQQVCTYYSNVSSPAEFAQIIFTASKAYNNCYILVEYESLGPQVAQILMDLGAENLLYTENAGRKGKKISLVRGDPGLGMSVGAKATGCSILKLLIEQNQLIINDKNTIDELKTFSRKNKTFCAEEGKHDDSVMTLVIFAWLSDQDFFTDLTDINTINKLREKTEQQIDEEMLPIGFVDRGPEEVLAEPVTYINNTPVYEIKDEMF